MIRPLVLALLAVLPLAASEPAWWKAFSRRPSLASRFRQESDSQVFGKLAQEGSLILAPEGRLRVSYDAGLTVACDGRRLVQYDPDTRTAQQVDLVRAVRDFPLLGLLLDPARLGRMYQIESAGAETVRLRPRETGLPPLEAKGRGGMLRSLAWTDPSGARQTLELLDPKPPGALKPDTFRFQVPAGTRWATRSD